jgi:diaminopropionate ammonia-lyase
MTGSLLLNQRLRLAEVAPPPGEPLLFHQALPGYRPTPVQVLPEASLAALLPEAGPARVLVKDESSRLGLTAFKVLGASWAIERVLRATSEITTLLAASAGNHGLAVARIAADRGLDCRIYLPADASPVRAEHIEATGARLIRVDGDYDAAVAAAATAAQADRVALVADVSDDPRAPIPRWVIDGYSTLFAELTEPVDVVLVPAGVGSLTAAAVEWAACQSPPPRVIAVEPVTAACVSAALTAGRPVRVPTPGTSMSGLNCGTVSAVAWPSLHDGLTGAVTVTDSQVHQAMRDLAGWGLAIGDCGAAPLAALRTLAAGENRELAGLGAGSRVLLIATEGVTDHDSYHAIIGSPDLEGRYRPD